MTEGITRRVVVGGFDGADADQVHRGDVIQRCAPSSDRPPDDAKVCHVESRNLRPAVVDQRLRFDRRRSGPVHVPRTTPPTLLTTGSSLLGSAAASRRRGLPFP